MNGKVCLVTGATSGLGKEAALGLARMGATVVAVARDAEKGAGVVADLVARSGNPRVEMLVCDLSSQQSIRAAAAQFKQRHTQLHVLINQAGLYQSKRQLTVDGIETMFAVNHLAYFLLTNLLLDVIKASAPARIVIGTGGIEAMGTIHFDDLTFEKRWRPFAAISQSKLGNTLFLHELARRLAGTGVTVTAFQPGGVRTNLATGEGGPFGMFMAVVRRFGTDVETGGLIPLHLATAPELEGVTGQYFNMMKPGASSARSRDPDLGKKLWDVSARLTGL